MLDAIVWFFKNIAMSFYNVGYAVSHPASWLGWVNGMDSLEDKQSLMRFVYYGGSQEFFFVIFTTFLVVTAYGMWRNQFMWKCVRFLEGIANFLGRTAAWIGLWMVFQQIVIVFMQRVFVAANIGLGAWRHDVSWWAEELKLFNAMIVALCVTYTFVQGSHVRVDLVYAKVKYRTKKSIDMFGSLFFMMPVAVLVWMYGWFFLWRHLIVPKPAASYTLDKMILKARAFRWNVEHLSFSPNGFDAYYLFKILLVSYAALVFMQAIAFFYRSYLERKEGPESEGKYLDKDTLGEGEEAYEGTH